MTDAWRELCELLDKAGAKLTFYGHPVTGEQVAQFVTDRVVARLTTGDPLNAERGLDLDAWWLDLGGEG